MVPRVRGPLGQSCPKADGTPRGRSEHSKSSTGPRETLASARLGPRPLTCPGTSNLQLHHHQSFLPPALDARLDEHLSSLAVEDWQRIHREAPGHARAFESPILACEVRLRKLEQLSLRLKPPNEVLSAIGYDLLRAAVATLPPNLRGVGERLALLVESAIYSEESSIMEARGVGEALQYHTGRRPHFLVARRQQVSLDRSENDARKMQQSVEAHLDHQSHMLEVMKMLHADEKTMLRQWLFSFWVVTFRLRRKSVKRIASLVASKPLDVAVPLACWKLFISELHLEKAKEACEMEDGKASAAANRITEVERQNDNQQRALQAVLQAATTLKATCQEQQQEHVRLQKLWDTARPELLMSVLSELLEFLYDVIIRVCRFSGLDLRQRLLGKDVLPLLGDHPMEAVLPEATTPEALLVPWLNRILEQGRKAAEDALRRRAPGSRLETELLELVRDSTEVRDLGPDLSNSVALCTFYAVLNLSSRRDGKGLAAKDLWPLQERDLELRAAHLCGLLRTLGQSRRSRCLLEPSSIAAGNCKSMSTFLACCFLQDPMLEDLPESMDSSGKVMLRQRMEEVVLQLERQAAGLASEALEDPTPLLPSGGLESLPMLVPEQFLLRWVNFQLRDRDFHQSQVENFSSDLHDGVAIGLLLQAVAPEIMPQPLASDFEGRLDQILTAAARCLDVELLTGQVMMDGQPDSLACFLAQLFLSRPNLSPKPNSPLSKHLQTLERFCREGLAALAAQDGSGQVMRVCMELEAHWEELMLAHGKIREANRTMEVIYRRMRSFLGETLVCRAQGNPRTMLDAKEVKELAIYTTLSLDRLSAMFSKENVDSGLLGRLEETLRRHYRLLRDVFQYYTASSVNHAGVSFEGLLKLYQDCKLRSRDLAPQHLELLFQQHLGPGSRTLAVRAFVEVLLQVANCRFRSTRDFLDQQLVLLIEQHLQPYACQDTYSEFQSIAYDPKVRQVLNENGRALRSVFLLYASLDESNEEDPEGGRPRTLNIKQFTLLLSHCGMLDGVLTEEATQEIFEGIQFSATEHAEESFSEGEDDDEQLAFTEFLDGLVVITEYRLPDPFTPFHQRVATLITQLFGAVQVHWGGQRQRQRTSSPQVDAMLSALQKKRR